MNYYTIKTENMGSGTPFVARLLLFILNLRAKVFITDDEKIKFDIVHGRFYDHAKFAFLAYKDLCEIHNKFISEVEQGTIASLNKNTIYLEKEIDTDARRLTYSILSEAGIAFKEFINEYPKLFDDFSLGFMGQDDKKYQKGLTSIREKNSTFADYLESNRQGWTEKLVEIRNKKEHRGWELPEYTFFVVDGKIKIDSPQIEGILYIDFLRFVLASLFTFAEEIMVYTLSINIRYEYVYEIPRDERRKEVASRFDICIADKKYKPWILNANGADMDLLL